MLVGRLTRQLSRFGSEKCSPLISLNAVLNRTSREGIGNGCSCYNRVRLEVLQTSTCQKSSNMTRLTSIFKEHDSQKFVFVEPGGNYGDYLTYHGAEKLAHNLGIEYKSLSHEELMSSKLNDESVIYIHGSGGFNP